MKRYPQIRFSWKAVVFYLLIAAVLIGVFFFEEAIFPEPSYLRLTQADLLHAKGLTGKDITIAVIDEGFENHHPFLKGQLSPEGYNTDTRGENVGETLVYKSGEFIFENHGTHISSILISTDKRLRGIAPKSNLLPVKLGVFHGDQSIVRALDFVAKSDARVVNLSFALSYDGQAISFNVKKALQRLAQADKLIVVAAGNEGEALTDSPYGRSLINMTTSPDIGGRMILVGAYTAPFFQEEKLAPFTSFPGSPRAGQFFLCAPGVEIEAAFADHKTGKLSGTSMAAPMVCGVAVLLMEAFPALSAQQIANLLLKGARKVNKRGAFLSEHLWGQGLLDACGSYEKKNSQ